jgi:hypothetical protein
VLQFHPLTDELRSAVQNRFAGHPIEIVDAPMAIMQSGRA